MSALRKLLAVLLGLISLALAIHFVAGELYGSYLPQPHLVWDYLNLLIAVGVVVTLIFHFQRKRAFDRQNQNDSVSIGYLSTNLLLFVSIILALWFFANWFEELNINETTPEVVVSLIWIAFNASFIVLGSVTAWQLWQDQSEDPARAASPGSQSPAPVGSQADLAFAGHGGMTQAGEGPDSEYSMTNPDPDRGPEASPNR